MPDTDAGDWCDGKGAIVEAMGLSGMNGKFAPLRWRKRTARSSAPRLMSYVLAAGLILFGSVQASAQVGASSGQTIISKTPAGASPPATATPPHVAPDSKSQLSPATPEVAPSGGGWSVEINRGAQPPPAAVRTLELLLEGDGTWLVFSAGEALQHDVLVLDNPYRVVIDLPGVTFGLPATAGPVPQGLVSEVRFGQLDQNTARIVLRTHTPVMAEKAPAEKTAGAVKGYRMGVRLSAVDAKLFKPSTSEGLPSSAGDTPNQKAEIANDKPVIVIDPGHGGIDSGAIGTTLYEKDVVLAVGRKLHQILAASGRYNAQMTRSTDVFLPLDRRVEISQKANASLFISLHADSITAKDAARNVRGATIYTLSGKASDELSRRLAEKENAADAAAGLTVIEDVDDDRVKGILLDLMSRESLGLSGKFSGLLVQNLRRGVLLAKDPTRSAAFRVLRQAQTPAVLVELGYVSNDRDENLLASSAWQAQVAASIAAAVDQFFAR